MVNHQGNHSRGAPVDSGSGNHPGSASLNQDSTLYLNATVFTMDRSVPRVESLLVRDGRIAVLGRREDVEAQADRGTRRVDLAGGTVIPGFNDCHCHILSFGLTLQQLDVGADAVRTIEDIRRAVAERAQATGEGWVVGRGYDQNALRERRHPTRFDLDEVSAGRPVVLWHTSGHALTCNSRALALAGISAATATPPGGEIERDSHGEPNGVLKESAATDLVARAMPAPTVEEGTEAVIRAMEVMASQGITSASDAATGEGPSIRPRLEMFRRALASGRLAGKITLMPQILYVAPPDSAESHRRAELDVGDRPDWLHVGPTKIFSDGAITTRTAALREPFADGDANTGLLIWEPNTLTDMIARAHKAGWQIATHAIGDRAIELVLDCYERALKQEPRVDHRHRIEHCMLLDRSLVRRIQELGVIPVLQPGFIGRLGDAYIDALGMDRASQLNPMALFDAFGVRVAFSSDRPVIPGAPLDGIRSAVRRVTPRGITLGAQHAISPLEAIRYYTAGSAYATHAEGVKGTLARGMPADFTVLSHDPTSLSPEEFDRIHVTRTVVAGTETYVE